MNKSTIQLQDGYVLEIDTTDALIEKIASHYNVSKHQVTNTMLKEFVVKATINAIDTSTFV